MGETIVVRTLSLAEWALKRAIQGDDTGAIPDPLGMLGALTRRLRSEVEADEVRKMRLGRRALQRFETGDRS